MRELGYRLASRLSVLLLGAGHLALGQEQGADALPFRQEGFFEYSYLGRVALALVFCLALAAAVVWFLRRTLYRQSLGETEASVVLKQFKRLSPRLSVYVVEIDGTRVALVQSGDNVIHIPLRGRDE